MQRTRCLNTRFLLPTLLCAGYSVKKRKYFININSTPVYFKSHYPRVRSAVTIRPLEEKKLTIKTAIIKQRVAISSAVGNDHNIFGRDPKSNTKILENYHADRMCNTKSMIVLCLIYLVQRQYQEQERGVFSFASEIWFLIFVSNYKKLYLFFVC